MKKVNQCSHCGGFCKPRGCELENIPRVTSQDVQLQMLDRIEELEQELARVKENLRIEREIAERDSKRIAGITAICKEMFT